MDLNVMFCLILGIPCYLLQVNYYINTKWVCKEIKMKDVNSFIVIQSYHFAVLFVKQVIF